MERVKNNYRQDELGVLFRPMEGIIQTKAYAFRVVKSGLCTALRPGLLSRGCPHLRSGVKSSICIEIETQPNFLRQIARSLLRNSSSVVNSPPCEGLADEVCQRCGKLYTSAVANQNRRLCWKSFYVTLSATLFRFEHNSSDKKREQFNKNDLITALAAADH